MSPFVIDAFEFCRLKERREGEVAVAELPRLARESVDQSGLIRWSLLGGSDKQGHPQLHLSVSGSVNLMCQRCLTPFSFGIESESVLVLAEDEAAANAIEELLDDEEVEAIVASRTFNVTDLIEDEALLGIPASPKHETCPDQLLPPVEEKGRDAAEKVSPFAVLKDLKNLKRQ